MQGTLEKDVVQDSSAADFRSSILFRVFGINMTAKVTI